jgi:two-component system chemotaxis sensor kinase CheA
METRDAEFLKRLLAMFKIEAREHLHVISSELTRLEKGDPGDQAEIVETMYREAHTLKGAARSVNLADLVSICQSVESVFLALKRGQISLSPQVGDLLHQTVDFCDRLVDGEKPSVADRAVIERLIRQLDDATAGKETLETERREAIGRGELKNRQTGTAAPPAESAVPEFPEPPPQAPAVASIPDNSETIRISTATLDSLLLQAEEMISFKLATAQHLAELRDLKKTFDAWKKGRQKETSVGMPRSRESGGPISMEPFIPAFGSRLTALVRTVEDDHRTSAALIDTLLGDMKKTLMLPFSSILEVFPRFVRDLARAAGKQVEWITEGGEIEIDRRVLEEMKDPLIHLVRNCLDHGIEKPDERERKNKPAYGKVKVVASSRDGKIEIAVSDDGRGMDGEEIKSSAVRHAVAAQDVVDKLGEQEALLLVFRSGVTTSPIITDISGRGLGLAIVKEKVEKLNGTVTVDTRTDAGTTFRLVVPLTLATFRGTLVRVAGQLFVLPSTNVERVARVNTAAIRTVENRETLLFDGRPISLVRLADVLELHAAGDRRQATDAPLQVALISSAEKHMAFMVDEVICEQEVLVKPLGRQLSRVRNIMGATVLGSGMVVPVLSVPDLLKTAVQKPPSFTIGPAEAPEKSSSVLVVEDSITARALLQNILESAGYSVKTAVDGVEAITALKSREFDIVVSDVEMPRMNGFELTARIRSDRNLSKLPVVLVTALESREDRERGIDVGANAYIVKSSFDQSNLLEVIERLT